MIRSMTAYGRAELQWDGCVLIAELRSVNHRYRDIVLKLPKNLQIFEDELKAFLASRIGRGRVEATILVTLNQESPSYSLGLNLPLVRSYCKIIEELAHEFGIESRIQPESILQLKDAIVFQPEPLDLERFGPGLREVLDRALEPFDRMRAAEGEAIKTDFCERVNRMAFYTAEVAEKASGLVPLYRQRLMSRIQALLQDVSVDEGRLAQEVAFYAERSDITEELVRIRSHLNQFNTYLDLDEAVGRRLDFLIQEIHREVNTLSAKASDASISTMAVEMKSELEKLREQVQNVE
jgi:uncharacterized protein (TIGR00255 family)